MRERIKMIMDAENMTPARFADSLDIGRAVISHILNGRNNPSLDVVSRILKQLPQINSDWLLTGRGSMYNNAIELPLENKTKPDSLDLFNQVLSENIAKQSNNKEDTKYLKENVVNTKENTYQNTEKEIIKERIVTAKKIKQIIIYYTDNTFETFLADK